MFPVAAIAGAGWLFLLVVLLIAPPSPGPHEGGGQGEGRAARRGRTRTPDPGDVPPAVVSLLARRLDRSGFGATMSAFREEVDAETRRLGLTRSRLSGRRIGLLLLLLFIPAVALIPVAAHGRGLAYAGGLYFAGFWIAVGVGVSRRFLHRRFV